MYNFIQIHKVKKDGYLNFQLIDNLTLQTLALSMCKKL